MGSGRWIIFGLLLLGNPAFAAKVTQVDAEKKQIMIDEGTDTQFVKKAKVCFYDANNVKAGCSFIRSAKPKSALIKIKNDKLFAKIQVGMLAKLEAGPSPSGAAGITADPAAPAKEGAATAKSYINAFALLPLVGPVGYQNLIYETPAGQQVDSMWTSDTRVKNVGGGLELGLGLGSFQLAAGARSRFYLPKKISSDYDDVDGDKKYEIYSETTASGTSFGAWLDFYWLVLDFGVVDFRLGNGIDFDSSKVNFESVQITDPELFKGDPNTIPGSKTLYQASSSLTALSLRFLPSLDFVFGPIDFTLGAIIYIPISQTPKFSLSVQDDPFLTQLNPSKTAEEDLKSALKHQAKAGADLLLSSGFIF